MSAREPVDAAHDLIERLSELAMDCPIDELWPGYTLAPESGRECTRAVSLLEEAKGLLEQCISREEPRYRAFQEVFDLAERRRWARERGAADPLN